MIEKMRVTLEGAKEELRKNEVNIECVFEHIRKASIEIDSMTCNYAEVIFGRDYRIKTLYGVMMECAEFSDLNYMSMSKLRKEIQKLNLEKSDASKLVRIYKFFFDVYDDECGRRLTAKMKEDLMFTNVKEVCKYIGVFLDDLELLY